MTKQLGNIPLSDIDFGNRQRKDYGELQDLVNSIQQTGGLIHPVTVVDKQAIKNAKELPSISRNDEARYLMMAGGRRFTAWELGEFGKSIPAYIYPKVLTADEIREIELIENLQRKELSWKEEAMMYDEIHRLQQAIHGKKIKSSEGGHGLQETADLVGSSKSTVHRNIEMAKALKAIPELANVKTKKEAMKMIKEIKKSHKADTKAKRVSKEKAAKSIDERKAELMDSYICGDFFEGVEKFKDNTFDLIEIDPPYAIDLPNVKKASQHKTMNYDEVEADEYEAFMRRVVLNSKKKLKTGGWLVLWYAIDPWHSMMVRILKDAGFKLNELPAIWIKNGGQTMQPERYFGSCYEPFLYARLGKSAKLNKPGAPNYIVQPKVPAQQKMHPTQRPIALMEEVIDRFTADGKILVPFAGSGVTIRAAYNKGLKAVGFDTSQDAKNKYNNFIADSDIDNLFEV